MEILLMNLPVPVPSVVWLPFTVGFCEVLQHTPLAVTLAPPSEDILPPQVAEMVVMLLTVLVVTVGNEAIPLNKSSRRQRTE